jgi:hypothetical protein
MEKLEKLVEKGQSNTKKGLQMREKLEHKAVAARSARNDYCCALSYANAYKRRFFRVWRAPIW